MFAFYGPEETVRKTRLVQLDDQWQPQASWRFPYEVVKRLAPYSNSGGAWGPRGLLYATEHDRAEMYALRVPRKEDVLELVDIVPGKIEGQGIAWDRSELGTAYGIRRKTQEIVALRLSHSREYDTLKKPVVWQRDPSNPILTLGKTNDFDVARCMNLWVRRE